MFRNVSVLGAHQARVNYFLMIPVTARLRRQATETSIFTDLKELPKPIIES